MSVMGFVKKKFGSRAVGWCDLHAVGFGITGIVLTLQSPLVRIS